ncbi:alpha/beta fold hydrolase [Agromyces seonyuensis]|uniref:Alpha/beta fold hydrolase n=1 Tax=Agromyces seonyuensis TaxID=2662446 RepID=A0A6I4NXR6_9MICO|nr:alpha/beta hydrolase [Agromyces seonyuensis]MWB98971.1 alpha/beta fold hydrolase [Agromyces seonyuensis]
MPHLSLPGASLYWESDGSASAPALLAIPGGMGSLRMWDRLVAARASVDHVVRFDPRGFGATIAERTPYANHEDAIALLDHLGIAAATIVGTGRGATIALDVALAAPDRVVGVVMVCGGPSGHPSVDLGAREERLLAQFDALHETDAGVDDPEDRTGPEGATPPRDIQALVEQELAIWAAGPGRALRDLDPAFLSLARRLDRNGRRRDDRLPRPTPLQPPAVDRLAEVEVPVLVMAGAHDLSPAIAHFHTLVEGLPNATGFRFDDSAHLPVLERPEEFERVLDTWLGEVSDR